MSEMRQLLRYEIPSLFLFIEIFWAVTCFVDVPSLVSASGIEYKDLSSILTALLAFLVVISIPIGWFFYQLYDAICEPHYKKNSINLLKKEISLPMGDRANKASNHEELLDMLLFNDKHGNKDLIYNVRGYWDHHDARYIVGFVVPLFSFIITSYILLFLHFCYDMFIWPWNFETRFPLANSILFIIFNLSIYTFVFKPHKRILDEIDARERFLILFKQDKISGIKQNPNVKEIFKNKEEKQN